MEQRIDKIGTKSVMKCDLLNKISGYCSHCKSCDFIKAFMNY